MCVALFIAAASFFLGQTNTLPRVLHSPVLLAAPVITPLLVMAFWVWRARSRGFSGPVGELLPSGRRAAAVDPLRARRTE
jgi:hypothetical protein